MIRLVQLRHANGERRVALVEENQLRLLRGVESIYALAQGAIGRGRTLEQALSAHAAFDSVSYDSVHRGASDWRLLPAFDHPEEPARCLVTGTGLTHKASAENRQAMHAAEKPAVLTDSMSCINGDSKAAALLMARSALLQNGFTKGVARFCALMASPSRFRHSLWMAEKRRKLPALTSLTSRVLRGALD